jgi:hypothetical protein
MVFQPHRQDQVAASTGDDDTGEVSAEASNKGISRTKSVFSMGSDLSIISEDESVSVGSGEHGSLDGSAGIMPGPARPENARWAPRNWSTQDTCSFGALVRYATQGRPEAPVFDAELRRLMEPFLRDVRERRTILFHQLLARGGHQFGPSPSAESMASSSQHSRYALSSTSSHPMSNTLAHGSTWLDASITPSLGVPYTELRTERPFLFDHENSYPLHTTLAETLGVSSLDRIHEFERCDSILDSLRDPLRRLPFHQAYDNFVTTFCIPLLHSMAMSRQLFHAALSDRCDNGIAYRYQAFPTITVHVPGGPAKATTTSPISCGVLEGRSVACLTFHIPLTPSFGTNSMFVESHPGKEDWHPLPIKSEGLGFLFDGSRCLSFHLDNTTSATAVFLDFQVLLYDYEDRDWSGSSSLRTTSLCPLHLLEDGFSRSRGSTYYDEAFISSRSAQFRPHVQMVTKRHSALLDVDSRSGPPFHRSD